MVWNKGNPAAGIPAKQIDNDVRTNNTALETVINFGHDLVTTETGWHNSGSAQMYSGSSAPTLKEDGSTALTSVDYNEKIWVNETTTPGIVNIYTAASTWTPLAQMIGMIDDDTMGTASAILPASSESIKAYVDTEQLLDLKLDGSNAMTAAMDLGSNLISNVTDPSGAQDAATKAYVDAKAHSNQKTGVYIGDGGSSKAITGLGFQPDFLMVIPEATKDTHIKTDAMGSLDSQNINATGSNVDDALISLDADGFTVGDGTGGGSNDNMNVTSENYYWIASKNS